MKKLIRKYLESNTSKEEKEKLLNWLEHQTDDIIILLKEEIETYAKETSTIKKTDAKFAFEEFKKEIVKRKQKKSVVKLFTPFYKYAASTVLLIGVYFFYETISNPKIVDPIKNEKIVNLEDSKIILTQEDGSKKIIKQEQKVISYVENTSKEEKLVFNEIKIPKGQVFRLVLSDSTIVWLNSDSKLKYPKNFIKGLASREVVLEGEAFFKVAHNKNLPFIVNTKNLNIEVLGTTFNVSSYVEEQDIKTTLVTGSVKVKGTGNKMNTSLLLTPNHQAIYNKKNNVISHKKVNTIEFTSWIDKKIIFNNTPFKELVKRIERTFNIIVVNNNETIKEELFSGQFDNETIEVIFKSLSTSFKFDYAINKNIITINP
ncbi:MULTISPECIES: FecR family protein [unclassified Polaribacter]|uniref:FecR family protein n=1 Tax=unclassified Polaribacter TaxID=196858 RepID=UPI0011BE88A2|nr:MULTISPECIES: FecR family protein [unclassified Polaribacter]TXD54094.1 FecR family protein [Polaribacter sp. IC063]TXD62610.1 FecR family protein [Polaribacter sp. IC066]